MGGENWILCQSRNKKVVVRFAYPSQRFQDWVSQQWCIWRGQRIDPQSTNWLMGPFGNVDSIADDFIARLAEDEHLDIERKVKTGGLLSSIKELNLPESEFERLSPQVIDFYENTTQYDLELWIEWSTYFRPFGGLVQYLYSRRLKQLNLPLRPLETSRGINSELIMLRDSQSGEVKYTVWYRVLRSNNHVIYSGVYSTCVLPCGKACVKAIFPLPRGNATVIMSPTVGPNGELHLDSSGEKFGDPGLYFLLEDSKGGYWAQYIRSFREHIEVFADDRDELRAEHSITLWKQRMLEIHFKMFQSKQL